MTRTAVLLGANAEDAQREMDKVVKFEQQLANVWDNHKLMGAENAYLVLNNILNLFNAGFNARGRSSRYQLDLS